MTGVIGGCLLTALLWIGPELDAKEIVVKPRPCPAVMVTIQQHPRALVVRVRHERFICSLTHVVGSGWGEFFYWLRGERAWYQGQVLIPCKQLWGS